MTAYFLCSEENAEAIENSLLEVRPGLKLTVCWMHDCACMF